MAGFCLMCTLPSQGQQRVRGRHGGSRASSAPPEPLRPAVPCPGSVWTLTQVHLPVPWALTFTWGALPMWEPYLFTPPATPKYLHTHTWNVGGLTLQDFFWLKDDQSHWINPSPFHSTPSRPQQSLLDSSKSLFPQTPIIQFSEPQNHIPSNSRFFRKSLKSGCCGSSREENKEK